MWLSLGWLVSSKETKILEVVPVRDAIELVSFKGFIVENLSQALKNLQILQFFMGVVSGKRYCTCTL